MNIANLEAQFGVESRLADLDSRPLRRFVADALACPGVDPNDDDDDKESDVDPGACGAD
jgi:hypothetical protein